MDIINYDKYLSETHYGDVETIGFWDEVAGVGDVHCLCTITDDDTIILWHDRPEFDGAIVWDKEDEREYVIPPRAGSLMDGFRYWYKIGMHNGRLSVHNSSAFDKPIVEKVVPKCKIPKAVWRDTFNQSKLQWFDRPCPKGAKSAHGLQAYGIKFGVKKPPIDDFTRFDAYILHRIIEDCKIQKKTQLYLDSEAAKLAEQGIVFTEGLVIEDEYAEHCAYQQIRGVMADVPHMEKCVTEWDLRSEAIATIVEPQLPPTCSANSARITRSELMEKLEWKGKIPPDEMECVKKGGEMVWQAKKPYYTPSTNFHRVVKLNQYSGFNLSHGQSPCFEKKNDLITWIKDNHPNIKTADWNPEKVVVESKVLNKNTCDYFEVEETATDIICGPHTRITFSASTMSQHEVVKGMLIRLGLKEVEEWNVKKDGFGQMVKAEVDMVVSYPKKAAPEHQMHFNVKKGEVIVTSPKVSEKDCEDLPEGLGQMITEFNTTVHRRRFFSNPEDPESKGLLAHVRPDGRIPAGVNNSGTATLRASHKVWVNAAGVGSLYGEEVRSSLIAPKGRKLVGADMKSAQLAIAAYYAKNETYYNAVASGQEVVKNDKGEEVYVGESAHCFSARLFDLVSHQEWQDAIRTQDKDLLHSIMLRRKASKGASFGVIFGCSGKKLAGMLKVAEHLGNSKKKVFLDQMGLQGVADWLLTCKDKYRRGNGWYIPIPFGFWVYCKSDHKAINYIIQGTEAACQKVAVNYFEKKLAESGLDGFKVLDYHRQNCGFTQ